MNLLKGLLKINRRWWASLLVIVIVVTCIVLGTGYHPDTLYQAKVTDMDGGWLSADGEAFTLSELPEQAITLTRSVEGIALHEKRLCMKSVDTFFDVKADGETIYSYCPRQPDFLGISYGMYIHEVPLPEDTSEITLVLTPIFPDAPPALLNTVIQDPGMFMGELFKEGIPGFCVCLLMMALGIVMIVAGLSSSYKESHQQIESFTLGFFAVLAALWSVNDTLMLQALTQNPAVVRLLNYVTLIFLPYFVVSFIASATDHQDSPFLPAFFLLTCLNFLVNVVLTTTGISDYFHLVKLSQVLLVIGVCMAVWFVIAAVRKRRVEKRFLRTILIGTVVLGAGGIADLVKFRIRTNVVQENSSFARIGSLLFLVLIGLYLIQENNRTRIENSKALARLAYTDSLTGLRNRQAFNEAETALLKDPEANCMIIQFDVNNLKKVNDEFGHAEGDRHLGGAASIILQCVGDQGTCYRTGGDEFIAIMNCDEAAAQKAIAQMKELEQRYNINEEPPVPMRIAYGMAPFRPSEGTLEKAEQLADERMYECKRIQKSLNKPITDV